MFSTLWTVFLINLALIATVSLTALFGKEDA